MLHLKHLVLLAQKNIFYTFSSKSQSVSILFYSKLSSTKICNDKTIWTDALSKIDFACSYNNYIRYVRVPDINVSNLLKGFSLSSLFIVRIFTTNTSYCINKNNRRRLNFCLIFKISYASVSYNKTLFIK